MKSFNTAGTCRPNEHYMVDITERLEIIRGMVSRGDYFCINRGSKFLLQQEQAIGLVASSGVEWPHTD